MKNKIRKILNYLLCKLTDTHHKDYACRICGRRCACGKNHLNYGIHAKWQRDREIFNLFNNGCKTRYTSRFKAGQDLEKDDAVVIRDGKLYKK